MSLVCPAIPPLLSSTTFLGCGIDSVVPTHIFTADAIPTSTSVLPQVTQQILPNDDFKSEERDGFNYASFDCGALIRSANKESSHSTSILLNSKDAYMLNPCAASKFVEIEVCQDVQTELILDLGESDWDGKLRILF